MPTIAALVNDVQAGKVSAASLVAESLKKIEAASDYNALISLVDSAAERAEAIDAAIANGETVGRLSGIPFIVKDNFLVEGTITTAASNILSNFKAPYTATSVALLEAEGAIVVAKANLDAFAHGSSTENSDFGVTKNPHDPSKVPGGSSGGSAAAIALDLVSFALGTDTGGSIRQPASFTGTVGYKPTYGLVSRYGAVAMASSTDVIGPITANVEDAALILDILAQKDSKDSTMIDRDANAYTKLDKNLKGLKIGVVKEYFDEGVDPAIKKSVQAAITAAEKQGAIIEEISIPELSLALSAYYIIVPAEVSSNLSRYDGIRYGNAAESPDSLQSAYLRTRTDGFNDENKRRIMIGTYVLSSGYYDAYYKKAQAVRTVLINKISEALKNVDVLVGPTTPTVAFSIGEKSDDPVQMYLNDIMTVAVNLVGIPAISIPAGKDGVLPIGMQLMAAQHKDRELLSVAAAFEKLIGYSA